MIGNYILEEGKLYILMEEDKNYIINIKLANYIYYYMFLYLFNF